MKHITPSAQKNNSFLRASAPPWLIRNPQSAIKGITVALPAFNEEATLEPVVRGALDAIEAAATGGGEVLIVNDGSTDRTGAIARDLALSDARIHWIEHSRNLGFAEVQRSCFRFAAQDWIFLLPADGQIDPAAILDFIPLCENHDLLLGIVAQNPERGPRRFNSSAYHALVNRVFKLPYGAFGACLMVRRGLVQSLPLRARTPVLMTELVVRARAAGARIGEVQVVKKQRLHGVAHGGRVWRMLPRILIELAVLLSHPD